VKAELTQLYNNLNQAENAPSPPITPVEQVSSSKTQDSLPSSNRAKFSDSVIAISSAIILEDHVLQAKLAKELIKLASSYKIQELTFDVQASKRQFSFSTWFSKIRQSCLCFPRQPLL
jgi:hypothetical protein